LAISVLRGADEERISEIEGIISGLTGELGADMVALLNESL
jgi:hypothetical protein